MNSKAIVWWSDCRNSIPSCPFSKARDFTGIYLLEAEVLGTNLECCPPQQPLWLCVLVWQEKILPEAIQPCLLLPTFRLGRMCSFIYSVAALSASTGLVPAIMLWCEKGFSLLWKQKTHAPVDLYYFYQGHRKLAFVNCLVKLSTWSLRFPCHGPRSSFSLITRF